MIENINIPELAEELRIAEERNKTIEAYEETKKLTARYAIVEETKKMH